MIDHHCHVYEDFETLARFTENVRLKKLLIKLQDQAEKIKKLPVNSRARKLQEKALEFAAKGLPEFKYKDLLMAMFSSNQIFYGGHRDLLRFQEDNGIEKSYLISHPPYIPHGLVEHLKITYPDRFEFYIRLNFEEDSFETLKSWKDKGARGFKIHLCMDGHWPSEENATRILEIINELEMPIIIHTGHFELGPLMKYSERGEVIKYVNWIETYPKINFTLAHMGHRHYHDAIEVAAKYANVDVESSWQNPESIALAKKVLGESKVYFGTDWPLNINPHFHY